VGVILVIRGAHAVSKGKHKSKTLKAAATTKSIGLVAICVAIRKQKPTCLS
jgi:hypothetical protein